VLVEGDTLLGGTGLRDGHGDTEDGVGSELALVGGLEVGKEKEEVSWKNFDE
jgi:hypothetical protein